MHNIFIFSANCIMKNFGQQLLTKNNGKNSIFLRIKIKKSKNRKIEKSKKQKMKKGKNGKIVNFY